MWKKLKIRKKGRHIKMDQKRNTQVEDILKTLEEEGRKKREREELLEKRKQRKRELEKIYVKKYFAIPEKLEKHKEYCRQYYIKNKERILRKRAEHEDRYKQLMKQNSKVWSKIEWDKYDSI